MFNWFKEKTIDATANLVEKTGSAFDELFTSDEERKAAEILLVKIKQAPSLWSHQLNMINANSTSWFNSGWRPAIGWVGAISALMFYVPQYIMAAGIWTYHAASTAAGQALPVYPVTDDGLWQLITLLIGGSVIRQIDKTSGTAKS